MQRILPDRTLTRAECTARYRKAHPDRAKAARVEWGKKHPEHARLARKRCLDRNRKFLRELRSDTPCSDCGNNFPWYVMEFDHRDGRNGSLCVTQYIRWCVRRLKEEISKCDIVCANCHAIRTHNRAVEKKQRRA